MSRMEYNALAGAWFGMCQGKIIRVEEETMREARAIEISKNAPPYSGNPAMWWNLKHKDGVTYTLYTPEHNVLEIVFDGSTHVLPDHYQEKFSGILFTRFKTHHYTVFQTDLKGWATKAQLDFLAQCYSWGEGPDYTIDHNLSAEDAASEE